MKMRSWIKKEVENGKWKEVMLLEGRSSTSGEKMKEGGKNIG